jgi:hypothetical protein
MKTIDVAVEQKPEHYVGSMISVTIKCKPSAKHLAEEIQGMIFEAFYKDILNEKREG